MRRRTFLQAAGSAAIVWPMPASAARDATLPLVAVLLPAPEESSKPRLAALREGLKDEGLLEGSHYSIEARFASGDFARLPEFAKELDELNRGLRLCQCCPRRTQAAAGHAARVYRHSSRSDRIRSRAELHETRWERHRQCHECDRRRRELDSEAARIFKDLVPNIKRLGMIGSWLPQLPGGLLYQEEVALRNTSGQLGFEFEKYAIKSLDDLGQAFAKASADDVDALYISGDPLLFANISRVMPHILAAAKPTLGTYPEWARAGLLLTYSNDLADGFRRAGVYAARKSLREQSPATCRSIRPASSRWRSTSRRLSSSG